MSCNSYTMHNVRTAFCRNRHTHTLPFCLRQTENPSHTAFAHSQMFVSYKHTHKRHKMIYSRPCLHCNISTTFHIWNERIAIVECVARYAWLWPACLLAARVYCAHNMAKTRRHRDGYCWCERMRQLSATGLFQLFIERRVTAVTARTRQQRRVYVPCFIFILILCIFLSVITVYIHLLCARKCFNELIAAIPISTCAVRIVFRSIVGRIHAADVHTHTHTPSRLCARVIQRLSYTHTGRPLSLSHHQMIDITFQFFWLDDDDDGRDASCVTALTYDKCCPFHFNCHRPIYWHRICTHSWALR